MKHRIAVILIIMTLAVIVPVAALAHDGWLLCHFVLDDVTGRVTLDCEPYTPPVTPTPEPTAVPPTPEPTATPAPPVQPNQYWHAPGAHDGLNVHEHGDAAPQWADDWSMATFGHAVMYGGDEATPNENMMKHQAYKGFLTKSGNGVELFIRYHAMSNPHDRSVPFHSYEVYARDAAGGISFWQGWGFWGWPDVAEHRLTRSQEVPGSLSPTWRGRDQFVIASPDTADYAKALACEQWYGLGGNNWGWSLGITICGATTTRPTQPGLETTDPMNQALWQPTGSLGLDRRLEFTQFGPDNPYIKGTAPIGTWYCVRKRPTEPAHAYGSYPNWLVSGAVAGPTACPAEWVAEYTASTFPRVGVYFEVGNTAAKSFPGSGVTLPN